MQFTFAKSKVTARPAFALVVPDAETVFTKMVDAGKTELMAWLLRNAVASKCDLSALAELPNKVLSCDALIAELEQAQASSSSIISAESFASLWLEIDEEIRAKFGNQATEKVKLALMTATGHNGKGKLLESQVDSILRHFTTMIASHEIYAIAVSAARIRKEEIAKSGGEF